MQEVSLVSNELITCNKQYNLIKRIMFHLAETHEEYLQNLKCYKFLYY